MKIGIDIDDTTFLTVKPMIKYADIYDEEIFGKKHNSDKLGKVEDRFYLKALYNWDEKTKFDFFHKYYKNVLEECTILPGADIFIRKLKLEGNTIHFITARLMNIENCDTKEITEKSLEKFNIPYDTLNLHQDDKIKFCKEKGIDILIEDSYETCKQMIENGMDAILMTTRMNRLVDSGFVKRVNNWEEIYNEIKKK